MRVDILLHNLDTLELAYVEKDNCFIASDKSLFSAKKIDFFLISRRKHVVVLIRSTLVRCF